MRIGVNCFLLQNHIGGMRQYFHRLFRELLANDLENTYVFFYFEHNIPELEQIGNDRWKDGAILLDSQDGANQHLDKIDIYFCPFGALWPRPIKVPSVVMIHDIQEKFYPEFFSKKVLFDREFYYDPSTRIADHVLTISKHARDSIIKFHGVSGSKITVAYHSLDDDFANSSSALAPNLVGLPEKFIFYPANVWLHKNHDNLLKALRILKNRCNLTVDCIFTGHALPGGYPLEEKINEYGLSAQTHVLGYLRDQQIKAIYRKAAFLCFASAFEGFGMPVLEAMALGCPVACSNATSLPEVAGDAAVYFDPKDPNDIADAIRKMWTDEHLRADLVAQGKNQTANFSPKTTAARHLEAFKCARDSYALSKYYYDKYVYDPIFKSKVVIKHRYLKWPPNGRVG